MASTDKTPPDMGRLQELADAWERGEALKLLPAEVEDEVFDALPWLLARERELTEALAEALKIVTGLDFDEQTELGRLMELLWRALHPAVLNSEEPKPKLHCGYCGYVGWTVEHYGRVTHKESCPARTDPWCQSHPKGCPVNSEEPSE